MCLSFQSLQSIKKLAKPKQSHQTAKEGREAPCVLRTRGYWCFTLPLKAAPRLTLGGKTPWWPSLPPRLRPGTCPRCLRACVPPFLRLSVLPTRQQ